MIPSLPRTLRTPALLLALLALPLRGDAWEPDVAFELPIPLPPRPFLLVDAPRRFTTGEPSLVRLQLRRGGEVSLGVFKVHDPTALAHTPPERQGFTVEASPMGAEVERLSALQGALPRRGSLVTLVQQRAVTVRAPARVRNVRPNESEAYDSNELDEGDVETWGVRSDNWSSEEVSLGPLPSGLYVVRAVTGAWAGSALLSVGDLTLLARRGDAHDVVLAVDAQGRALQGLEVEASEGARTLATARTDARGEARFPAMDNPTVRFLARRGEDLAWADVPHARMETCDPRVYLATGRPVFRAGEAVHLRGHLRGCVGGRPVPLGDEPVSLWPAASEGDQRVSVRTDRDGNFTAVLVARSGGIRAEVRGREHRRTIQLDGRSLPARALRVTLDRPWAAAGEPVVVSVADDQGGWPTVATVEVTTPAGRQSVEVGPGRPAVVRFVAPETSEPLARITVTATLAGPNATTQASADLWTGRHREVLGLASPRSWGLTGATFPVTLRASDLGGAPASGSARLTVRASDGNRPQGAALWSGALALDPRGEGSAGVPLSGPGPWWLEASKGEATTSLVVWERPRPPALSSRGELAVRSSALEVQPGESLDVALRAPTGGATWVTLEQGSVWESALVPSGGSEVRWTVPEGARGLATVVATHVRAGRVRQASATTEVATSRRLSLALETDKRVYASAERARVTVTARDAAGGPRDGVLSLWLADAGYWELGEEDHPSPDDLLRLPGRRADAGDTEHPQGYGAEAGRRLETRLEWNGRALPRSTFRHAWGYGGELVSLRDRGGFGAVATALARAAGFPSATVCAERARDLGTVSLLAQNLPWDLVALRVGEVTDTYAHVAHGRLEFSCDSPIGAGGGGSGSGYGSGAGRGLRGTGRARTQVLEGTLFFLGNRRLGPEGRAVLDVPLPDHPGRWRFEALVIADDGGGDLAHAVVSTSRPVEARLELVPSLAVGDVTHGEALLRAPALAGRAVSLTLEAPRWLRVLTAPPPRVTVGADGSVRVPISLRAEGAGEHTVILAATPEGRGVEDAVRVPVSVREHHARRPLAVRALLGPEATVVDVPLPPLAEPATLDVHVDGDLESGIDQELARLHAPRWDLASLSLDRLASLRALRLACEALPPALRVERAERVDRAIASETGTLRALTAAEGGGRWWRGLPPSPLLTALALDVLGDDLDAEAREGLYAVLRSAAPTASGAWAAPVAAVLAASREPRDRPLAQALAARIQVDASGELGPSTWLLRAYRALGDAPAATAQAASLASLVAGRITRAPRSRCAGVAWFLCFTRLGERGEVARATRLLLGLDPAGARPLALRVARWLSENPAEEGGCAWGSAESDVLSLVARLGPGRGADTRYEVRSGGVVVARGDGRSGTSVVTRGAGLQVVFAASEGRFARVRVDGVLHLAPDASPSGPAALVRRLDAARGGRELVLEFVLPRDVAWAELTVPLPGGLELGAPVGARPSHRVERWEPFDWYAFDREPGDTRPRVERVEGAVTVRFRRMVSGRHELRLPVIVTAPGDYAAGPAWLSTDRDDVWAVAPPLSVSLPAR